MAESRAWSCSPSGKGTYCDTQAIPLEPSDSARERFERERHRALSALPVSDPATVPWFVCGSVPSAFSDLLQGASPLPAPKLNLSKRHESVGFEWPALAAARAGLLRNASSFINLLPAQERWQPHRAARLPVYALGATATLLALTLASHAWIERALYGRALERAIRPLKAPAEQVRRQNQEASTLETRAAVLEDLRAGNWQKLRLLSQLTKLLPDGTWLEDLQISEDAVEISGRSGRTADLVPPLENFALLHPG